jgi:glycosyltransferase involved in cell wall biosynthesis
MNKNVKIVMIAMFKNEAKVLKKMLDSVSPYIDYWVIQNNGSTDGSDQITREWAEETGIPGVLYDVEEGWIGFGWNRDHLIRTCQSIDHGCDWILKMDCDETLEVYQDFDWSLLENKNVHSFNIPAVNGSSVYYRTWMWRSDLPWRFNHDPCHETIYCEISEIGSSYSTFDLPIGFNQIGSNDGQSWSVPTKFMSDALILEEKMIREGTMLSNLYHFWYIGKSYNDCYKSTVFPLGKSQQFEYGKRSIYYFNEYINHVTKQRGGKIIQDEMCYLALIFIGEVYQFMEDNHNAILAYKQAEQFAPKRNDHLWALAHVYKQEGMFKEMLTVTERMMLPERTNAFPEYSNFIEMSIYNDHSSQRVQTLHAEALKLNDKRDEKQVTETKHEASQIDIFSLNANAKKRFFVVDNFYDKPDVIRDFALNGVEYKEDLRWYKGLRSTKNYAPSWIKTAFEEVIGDKIHNWESYSEHGVNGCFQIMMSKDQQVYHYDEQKWAAMIYLSPNAPFESGTRLHASKINGARHSHENSDIVDDAFHGDFYDQTKFHTVDSAGNVYNRLVIMDARHIHSAGNYFGNTLETGRLTHLFFFD